MMTMWELTKAVWVSWLSSLCLGACAGTIVGAALAGCQQEPAAWVGVFVGAAGLRLTDGLCKQRISDFVDRQI